MKPHPSYSTCYPSWLYVFTDWHIGVRFRPLEISLGLQIQLLTSFPCVGAWDGFHVYVSTKLKNFYSYKKRYPFIYAIDLSST